MSGFRRDEKDGAPGRAGRASGRACGWYEAMQGQRRAKPAWRHSGSKLAAFFRAGERVVTGLEVIRLLSVPSARHGGALHINRRCRSAHSMESQVHDTDIQNVILQLHNCG